MSLGSFEYSLLDLSQLDLQNLFQVIPPQGVKNNHLVQAVHEFGRKFAPCSFYGGTLHLQVQSRNGLIVWLNEAHPAAHEFRDFAPTQIGGQENNRPGQIYTAIVAQSQSRLVQHAQQKLP